MSNSSKVNRGRTLARSQALQVLFQAEALNESVDRVLSGDYLLSKGPLDEYAAAIARGCWVYRARIDAALRAVSERWPLERMPGPDRNLLRLAVYEMRFAPEGSRLDDAIVIDEAVEVAKAYGTDESARFVNGVLGRIAREPELPGEPEAAAAAEDTGADAATASEPAAGAGE
ncbi:MAG: transcription antitermination factor NusB [Collinsella sp.]|nr:transcription antitermination factor NusB [Collinsella sp.]